MKLIHLGGVTTIRQDKKRCTNCGTCLDVCPRVVFASTGREVNIVDADACIECGACALNCPPRALFVKQGVGCAAAQIMVKLTGKEASCGCDKADCC